MSLVDYSLKAALIIADSGGRVVGRTRLQKIAYLLTVTGQEDRFLFSYKHYGPFSEGLANAVRMGGFLKQIHEVEHQTSWGGSYSIYTSTVASKNLERYYFAKIAAEADAVELELAATAVFLAKEGYQNPWAETARRKPEKAEADRIVRAKNLLGNLSNIKTPEPLPQIF